MSFKIYRMCHEAWQAVKLAAEFAYNTHTSTHTRIEHFTLYPGNSLSSSYVL